MTVPEDSAATRATRVPATRESAVRKLVGGISAGLVFLIGFVLLRARLRLNRS
jgi:hypothetical protein